MSTAAERHNIFKDVGTFNLLKKAVVYYASKSDFILHNGESLAKKSYKVFGKSFTNSIIENTGGEVFTAGPTIKTLTDDAERFYTDHGLWSCGNYVLEGIETDDVRTFDNAKDYLIKSLDLYADGKPYCHLAIKLTGLGHMDMFKIYDKAQSLLLTEMFGKYSQQEAGSEWKVLHRSGVEQFLKDQKIEYTTADVDEFFELAKSKNSKFPKSQIGEVEFYHNVHAHYVYTKQHETKIISRICDKVGLTQSIREAIVRLQNRFEAIIQKSQETKSLLFVDAEQTYIQRALDSLTNQFNTKYHKDNLAFILNGYQSYLKAVPRRVRLEYARCREMDIGCGIKLIRGAYMEEERRLAKQFNYESPVWDTIEDTHKSYNTNLDFILNNLDADRDFLLVGSHNTESCLFGKKIIKEKGLTNKNVIFGQLKGFSDSLSFSLAKDGVTALKYLPYGPTEYLIPYLMRRGLESKTVMREHLFLHDIMDEIKSRANPKTYF